ncbi:hypothetical protein FJY90_02725 [Candidatus Gottesmanbacteria bacterium]|nr:hypothetical protein [Candidatus Gottesmanbacteria bacterium]
MTEYIDSESNKTLPGRLNKDQFDALRLETSNLSPGEHEQFMKLVIECNDGFVSLYRNFIIKIQNKSELERKFLMMDSDTYQRFYDEWYRTPLAVSYTAAEDKGYMREYTEDEGGFVAGYIPDLWDHIPSERQKGLIDKYGGVKRAKDVVKSRTSHYIITHEIAHTYQDDELPLTFVECGANYYARVVMKEKGWGKFSAGNFDRLADFYEKLIDKYGDDIHRIFFGQDINAGLHQQVLNEYSAEVIADLFPHLRLKML